MAAALDFAAYIYIDERTQGFTGRAWVLAEIDRWLADPAGPTFFIITSELGVGKSALAAIDEEETLWQVYQAVQEVDSWWGRA